MRAEEVVGHQGSLEDRSERSWRDAGAVYWGQLSRQETEAGWRLRAGGWEQVGLAGATAWHWVAWYAPKWGCQRAAGSNRHTHACTRHCWICGAVAGVV